MRSTRRSRWHARVAVLCLAGVSLTGAEGAGAKVLLLPAGSRTSVVVELDDETPKATAIEATDNQSVAVEIGPVRGKVINQLLEAAKDSPLVSQVRVRGITQGADGTVITIYVTAKTPVSGSVRRAQRRIYIDLEPLGANGVGPRAPDRLAATEAPKPTQTTGTTPAKATPPAARVAMVAPPPPPPARSAATAAPPRSPQPAPAPERTQVAQAAPAVTPPPPVAPPAPLNAPATSPAAAETVLPKPQTAVGTYTAGAAPMTSTPSARAVTPGPGALSEIQRQAEQLTRIPDVKALERLKADLQAQRSAMAANGGSTIEHDALLVRFDQFLIDAQRNQLAADASLFRKGAGDSVVGSAPTFQQALRPLKPELESVSGALRGWSGGALPPANLQGVVASLLPRLRSLKPPANIATAHSWMCESLDALALMWAKAAVEPPPEGSETAVIDRARQAVDDFLRLEATLSAPPSNAAR
jgi:hypothetical protein